MNKNKTKLWVGLGAFTLVGAGVAIEGGLDGARADAAQQDVPAVGAPLAGVATPAASMPGVVQLAFAGGEAGHGSHAGGDGGEGGEGGEAGAATAAATDPVAYIEMIQYIRGHLDVGRELYEADRAKDAMIHFVHPAEEIYEALEPALKARGAAEFKAELDELVELAESGASAAEVGAAVEVVMARLDTAVTAVPEAERTKLVTGIGVAINLLKTAAEEYDIAIDDGQLVNVAEYQDSLGFMRVAKAMIEERADALKAAAPGAYEKIQAQFEALAPAWPSAVPPTKAPADPADVRSAVSRIELATSNI